MQRKVKNIVAGISLALIAVAPACGYHFSGTGGIVPEGTKTISIPVFFNATNEPYVDVDVTQAVVEEFLTDGRLEVVSLEDADLALRGRIIKYEAIPVAYTSPPVTPTPYVQLYLIHMVLEASLEDLRSKKILWQEKSIESSFISEYPVSFSPAGTADISATKIAKEAAIKKASQDIASTLRSRVMEGF